MATTAPSVASATPPSTASAATTRPQLRSSIGASAGGGNRRSTQSPVDGPQRRNSQQHKGWQSSPAQQRYNGSGMPSSSSPTPGQSAPVKGRAPGLQTGESDTHDKHMHDRTLFLLCKLLRHEVVVTVKTGARYSGIMTGADPRNNDLGVVIESAKLVRVAIGESEDKGKEGQFVGGGKKSVMVFEGKDVVDLQASGVNLDVDVPEAGPHQNGAPAGFKTDADISGNAALRERELHKWQPDEQPDIGLGLEDPSTDNGPGWDQFEANKRLFGVRSDFDENIYTTRLDKSHPEYERRATEAARIAAEIEGQSAVGLSAHVAEERGLAVPDDSGMDEEDKYSGVQRSAPAQANSNRYTPPARRAPTGQPTVPGAPHDPAIIASQLARPETLQQRQQAQSSSQATAQTQQPTVKTAEETIPKLKERPGLPEIIAPRGGLAVGSPKPTEATSAIEREISLNFKNFVTNEKERVKKKKADMAHRDRESKLRELKKFSESFTLKTAVPQDLIPILAKDKTKQAEIIEKAKHGATKAASSSSSQSTPSVAVSQAGTPGSQTGSAGGKVPPPYSFAARDPERFKRETSALLQGFPKLAQPMQSPLNQNVRRVQLDKTISVRSPVPVAEPPRPQVPPTGPAASSVTTTAPGPPRRLNVNARPFEFKPNPSAAAFTPTSTGPGANVMPSPTVSSQANATSRATSPSVFFGNKRLKTDQERPSIRQNFNPFERMKKAKAEAEPIETAPRTLYGNSNDYIDKPWFTQPIWSTDEANKDKSYKAIFAKVEFDPNSVHSPQPPHIMPPQPHHQQLGAHMSHVGHPPHVPHQPHHGPIPQHLGIPPHYEQDPHIRQMSSPSSVMPSPSLHNATVAPYQQSPVPHPSQLAMYPGGQGAMGQYGGPGAPAGHQFGFYNGGFRGAPGGGPMMMHGPQPVPYPAGGQFVHQMYSPQQPQAYLNNGPPPPTTQGYPSPGRPAPMMMHQGSSQGTPGGAPMMPYGMQPGQSGPMYGAQGQQQMGMIRGQPPPPPHQGGPPPPPQYFHGPQGHYPPGRGNSYPGSQGQQPGPHNMAPPPPQQIPHPPAPQQQLLPQQSVDTGEEAK